MLQNKQKNIENNSSAVSESFENLDNLDEDELFEFLDNLESEKNNTKIKNQKETEKGNEKNYCLKCDTSDNLIEDHAQGILVCIKCGNVISNILDESPEWRDFGEDGKESNARCSGFTNFFLPESSIGTTMACSNRSKLKILHNWTAMPYKERSLYEVLKEISDKCRRANIIKYIEDDAKILYKNISDCKHIGGKNIGKSIITRGSRRLSIIAACIYYACKRKGKTRSPKEIAKLFNLKHKNITRGCRTFLKLLKIKKMAYQIDSSSTEDFILRYCKELHIQPNYIDQATNIAKNIKLLNIATMHTPFSVATGSIMLIVDVNNLKIDRKTIALKFNVSEVTIIKSFKKIEQYKDILINNALSKELAILLEKERETLFPPSSIFSKPLSSENDAILYFYNLYKIHKDIDFYIDQVNNFLSEKSQNTQNYYNKIMNGNH